MRKTVVAILTVSVSCLSATVSAAEQMKPGLWEVMIKSDAFKNIPKMSPEQMKQMRDMGVNVPQMQDGGMVSKVCITKEMAARDAAAEMAQNESGCESKNVQRTGNSYSGDIVCNGPNMKGSGKVKGSYTSNERFSSTYEFKGTAHGQPVNHRQESTGKWLSADCGSVKPMAVPANKK
jgi:hypothetical protein